MWFATLINEFCQVGLNLTQLRVRVREGVGAQRETVGAEVIIYDCKSYPFIS